MRPGMALRAEIAPLPKTAHHRGMTSLATSPAWRTINPTLSTELGESRLQLHYAAQFATALGISYLPPKADDSHTNLGWDGRLEALKSRGVQTSSHLIEVAIRPADLALLVLLDGSIGRRIPLHGSTIGQSETALRDALASAGLNGERFTLKRHYELPGHPVSQGANFDTSRREAFEQLAAWYANASVVLDDFSARIQGAEVRCWPHHFDIATLVPFGPGRSSGAGMLPGDEMFPEPYFYVNAYPAPAPQAMPHESALAGGGVWNSDGWFGAVLTGSRLTADPSAQAEQIHAFLDSAFKTCSSLLRR
jgi:hypothetical protein